MPSSTALTKPWFEITVPSTTLGSTTTSNVMVATLAGCSDASAGIEPGVGSAGELISMPFTSGDRPADVRDRGAVQRRAARDVGRVHRDLVAQHDVVGIVVADVLDGDRVAQRLAGEQDVRVAGQVGGDLLHRNAGAEDRSDPRRVLVAGDTRDRPRR